MGDELSIKKLYSEREREIERVRKRERSIY
jgi:hypothetical protein